jgi:hypothetical protein
LFGHSALLLGPGVEVRNEQGRGSFVGGVARGSERCSVVL